MASRKNYKKTIFVAETLKFVEKKVFSGERFTIKGLFYTSYKMAISVQIPMLKVNYFIMKYCAFLRLMMIIMKESE